MNLDNTPATATATATYDGMTDSYNLNGVSFAGPGIREMTAAAGSGAGGTFLVSVPGNGPATISQSETLAGEIEDHFKALEENIERMLGARAAGAKAIIARIRAAL
jgi:hypothetical protein